MGIKEILKTQERSVSWLQRKTKISRYKLDLIVFGKASPTVVELEKISGALQVNQDIFLKADRKE